jgi:hypothetical protein
MSKRVTLNVANSEVLADFGVLEGGHEIVGEIAPRCVVVDELLRTYQPRLSKCTSSKSSTSKAEYPAFFGNGESSHFFFGTNARRLLLVFMDGPGAELARSAICGLAKHFVSVAMAKP